MKISLYILLILAAFVLAAAGCTRNNGRIGSWFGTWQVVAIEIDGESAPGYAGNIIVRFQNNIIQTTEQDNHHGSESWWATWTENTGTLTIDGKGKSIAPGLLLPADCVVNLDIIRYPGSAMEWRYVADNGSVIDYKLKKLY